MSSWLQKVSKYWELFLIYKDEQPTKFHSYNKTQLTYANTIENKKNQKQDFQCTSDDGILNYWINYY